MRHYWDIFWGGKSESSIYKGHTFQELVEMGYYYTASQARRDSRCRLSQSKLRSLFVSRFSPLHYEEALLNVTDNVPYAYLNEIGMYSPTGRLWSYSSCRVHFGKAILKHKQSFHNKPTNISWYKEVNDHWRTVVEECDCTTLNAVCKEFVSRGIKTRRGKIFTRQTLTYIVERCPDFDWELRSELAIREAQKDEFVSMLDSLDLGEFSSKVDVYAHFGIQESHRKCLLMSEVLDENGWRNNKDEWYDYWESVFEFCRGILRDKGWVGWNTLVACFREQGILMYNGKDWEILRLSRLCRKYGFDKEEEYEIILRSYVSSWLSEYEGSNVLCDLCSDLNGRGYVMPTWYEWLHPLSRKSQRQWTEALLQRAISDGLL